MWQIDQVTLRLFIAVCEEGTIARAAEREFDAGRQGMTTEAEGLCSPPQF